MPRKDPVEKKAYDAAYRMANRDKMLAYAAGYYARNRAELLKADRVHHAANRERENERMRAYHAANQEKENERSRAYYAAHKPDYIARVAQREAMILGATVGNLEEIKEIYKRAKETPKIRCYLCGKLIPMGHRHVDHIVPLSKGGAHRSSNLAIACDACNLSKGAKQPEEIGILI